MRSTKCARSPGWSFLSTSRYSLSSVARLPGKIIPGSGEVGPSVHRCHGNPNPITGKSLRSPPLWRSLPRCSLRPHGGGAEPSSAPPGPAPHPQAARVTACGTEKGCPRGSPTAPLRAVGSRSRDRPLPGQPLSGPRCQTGSAHLAGTDPALLGRSARTAGPTRRFVPLPDAPVPSPGGRGLELRPSQPGPALCFRPGPAALPTPRPPSTPPRAGAGTDRAGRPRAGTEHWPARVPPGSAAAEVRARGVPGAAALRKWAGRGRAGGAGLTSWGPPGRVLRWRGRGPGIWGFNPS